MDRRVRRTVHALQGALIELILERGFEAITVSDITERADVGRSTFYAHFADKEDLLQGSLEQLRHLLEASPSDRPGVHPALAFALPMLEHAAEMRPLFAATDGRRSGELIQDLVNDIWADLIRTRWAGADERAVRAVAGAFGATLRWWLTRAPELAPSEVDERFRALMEPALRNVPFAC